MPTYVYKFVDTGETIEVQQAFTDDALTEARHPESGDVMPVKKVFTPVGVTFKGSGFYKTDNRGSSKSKASTSTSTSESSSGDSSSSTTSTDSSTTASSTSTSSTSSTSNSSGSSGSSKAD